MITRKSDNRYYYHNMVNDNYGLVSDDNLLIKNNLMVIMFKNKKTMYHKKNSRELQCKTIIKCLRIDYCLITSIVLFNFFQFIMTFERKCTCGNDKKI